MSLTVAMLVPDAKRMSASDALSILTPEWPVGFIRGCCAIDPSATFETPAIYWYNSTQIVPEPIASLWSAWFELNQDCKMFTAINAENAYGWAVTNLESEGLQFIPDEF